MQKDSRIVGGVQDPQKSISELSYVRPNVTPEQMRTKTRSWTLDFN